MPAASSLSSGAPVNHSLPLRDLADPSKLVGLPEQIEEVLEGPCRAVSLAFNPFGTLLATGCGGGEVVVWDYETRGISRTFKHHR